MKYILLFIIHLYWFMIPETKRKKCIFKQSCSKYVYEITIQKGLLHGLGALAFRIRNCRPEFDIYTDYLSGKRKMLLKTGYIVEESEIAEGLM